MNRAERRKSERKYGIVSTMQRYREEAVKTGIEIRQKPGTRTSVIYDGLYIKL